LIDITACKEITLTIKEAMEVLRIKSRTTFYRLVKEGKIKPVKISARKVLVKREDIERLLNQDSPPTND